MYKVIIIYHNGKIESDKTFDNYGEAVKRVVSANAWYSQFGGMAMVLPVRIAHKVKEGN